MTQLAANLKERVWGNFWLQSLSDKNSASTRPPLLSLWVLVHATKEVQTAPLVLGAGALGDTLLGRVHGEHDPDPTNDATRDRAWLRGRSMEECPEGFDPERIDTAWRAVSPFNSTVSRALATCWGPLTRPSCINARWAAKELIRDPTGRLLRTEASDAGTVPCVDHGATGNPVEAEPLLDNR
jgi:hypothetical protein